MRKIFSVEDDKDLQDLLKFSLNGFGYDITVMPCAEDLFEILKTDIPDLILLDIMLPGMDGSEALKLLKKDARYKDIPIIMLTAKTSEMNIVSGLNIGADDYIIKPFSVMELSARINAQLRKTILPEKIKSGNIIIDIASREAYMNEEPLSLTLKEFELLYALIKSPNIVQKRDDLLSTIWGYEYLGETRTLDMHIRTLRAKLKTYANNIVTVRGVGFKYDPK